MTLRDKIELVVKGTPILSEYSFMLTEKSFKEYAELKFVDEDDINPFSLASQRFLGHFHGHYGREFSVKPKSSFFRKDSIGNSIWVHGKVEPKEESGILLKVTYYRTNYAKFGQWVFAGMFGFLFLIISIRTLGNLDFMNFLILSGALVFFYLIITLMSITRSNRQIAYFEKHFIDEIRKK